LPHCFTVFLYPLATTDPLPTGLASFFFPPSWSPCILPVLLGNFFRHFLFSCFHSFKASFIFFVPIFPFSLPSQTPPFRTRLLFSRQLFFPTRSSPCQRTLPLFLSLGRCRLEPPILPQFDVFPVAQSFLDIDQLPCAASPRCPPPLLPLCLSFGEARKYSSPSRGDCRFPVYDFSPFNHPALDSGSRHSLFLLIFPLHFWFLSVEKPFCSFYLAFRFFFHCVNDA